MFFLPLPFETYSKMFNLYVQTSQMLMFSGEVIFRRSCMINQGLLGKRSWADPEFTKLWQEKNTANMEFFHSISKSMVKKSFASNKGSIEKNIAEGIEVITASTRPYYTKTKSNAQRLRKKDTFT